MLTHSWLLCQYNPGFSNTALGATVNPPSPPLTATSVRNTVTPLIRPIFFGPLVTGSTVCHYTHLAMKQYYKKSWRYNCASSNPHSSLFLEGHKFISSYYNTQVLPSSLHATESSGNVLNTTKPSLTFNLHVSVLRTYNSINILNCQKEFARPCFTANIK